MSEKASVIHGLGPKKEHLVPAVAALVIVGIAGVAGGHEIDWFIKRENARLTAVGKITSGVAESTVAGVVGAIEDGSITLRPYAGYGREIPLPEDGYYVASSASPDGSNEVAVTFHQPNLPNYNPQTGETIARIPSTDSAMRISVSGRAPHTGRLASYTLLKNPKNGGWDMHADRKVGITPSDADYQQVFGLNDFSLSPEQLQEYLANGSPDNVPPFTSTIEAALARKG